MAPFVSSFVNIADVGFQPSLPTDLDHYAGMMAAQHELISAGGLLPLGDPYNTSSSSSLMLLNITYVQGVSFVNTTATDFYNSYSKSRLFTCGGLTGGYVGFLSPSVGNSDAQVILYQALKLKPKPMFGPDTVSNFMYDPTSREVIHFNVPADIEAGQLFYYSMHSSMHCTFYAIVRLNISAFADFYARLSPGPLSRGLRAVEYITYPMNNSDPNAAY